MAVDLRQWSQWGDYLKTLGWQVEKVGGSQIFIRKLPLLPFSVIKIQRPINPLPLTKIDQIAQKYHALFVLIEPDVKNYHPQIFLKNDYQPSKMIMAHTATILIDLKKSQTKLWRSLSENARRNINKAQSYQLKIQTIFTKDNTDDFNFELFFKLFKSLGRIKKFYIPSFTEYYKKYLSFRKKSIFIFAYTDFKKEPLAAVWLGYSNNTMVYLNSGITQDGYQKLANYLLLWYGLKLAQKLKIETFDFEGIFDPRFPHDHPRWVNFSEFKKRFHGEIVEYPAPWIKIYHPVFKFLYLCSITLTR